MKKILWAEILVILAILVGIIAVFNVNVTTSQEQARQLSSYQDLKDFINNSLSEYSAFGGGFYGAATTAAGAAQRQQALPAQTAEVSPAAQSTKGTEDFSQTNIQVAGVDEPDIVKNDGKYIYTISGNEIIIVDAYPAETSKILSTIKVDGTPLEIFINKDKLVVFAGSYGGYVRPLPAVGGGIAEQTIARTATSVAVPETEVAVESSIASPIIYPYYSSRIFIGVYDVSDRSNPVLKRNITMDGDYIDARMIGDYIYPIIDQPIYYAQGEIPLPQIYSGSAVRPAINFPEVYYFDNLDYSYRFTNVFAINTQNDNEDYANKVFVMGYTQNIFVSTNNIYITYTKQLSQSDLYDRLIDEVIIPSVPSDVAANITQIKNSDAPYYQKYQQVQDAVDNYLNTLNPEERAVVLKAVEQRYVNFQIKIAKETEKTVAHKISIDRNSIQYQTAGEAPGTVLNQFSMDESEGYFRVATTTREYTIEGRTTTKNHLYVLDSGLSIVGKVEDLAPGETIYSARFIGNRAYMVTFRQVDPLFVIDLTDPRNPQVLGQLKITGFSSYLHPYDENHIIGIGKEATEEGRVTGMKIALFEVSDPANPKEISKYEIGDRGTDSFALYDHKAFLFDKEKKLLVIPVLLSEITDTERFYGDYTFQGAYVFNLDLDNGFVLKGKITHLDNVSDKENYYYYYSPFSVKRSLYIGDTLYTVSDKVVKANSISDLSEQNRIELPYNLTQYYPIY